MTADSRRRFILVTRKTRLQELIERFNTWPQAKFYLEHNQVDVEDYLSEHDRYQRQLVSAEKILKDLGRLQLLERSFLPNYQFSPDDIVVVIGQDGLVANTLKYLDGQPVIGINPDPARWDGKLLPFEVSQLSSIIEATLAGSINTEDIVFARAETNDGQCLLAVNDLFIGPRSHSSLRYSLNYAGVREVQSSSGVIVSTGFGSSGWFQSVLCGAMAVAGRSEHPLQGGFSWRERRLQFAVREPFPSQTTATSCVFGAIKGEQCLTLESHTPENGVIFSDGIQEDYLSFNSGALVTVSIAPVRGNLVVG